jgi:hypothetical protein
MTDATAHTGTQGNGIARNVAFRWDEGVNGRLFMPRGFSKHSRRRFVRDRWQRWLSYCGGKVTDQQAAVIRALIDSEWDAIKLAAGGDMSPAALDARIRLRGDMRRALRSLGKPARPAPTWDANVAAWPRGGKEAAS